MPITISGTTNSRIGFTQSTLGQFSVDFDGSHTQPADNVGSMNSTIGDFSTSFEGQFGSSASFDGDISVTLGEFVPQIIGNQIQNIDGSVSLSLGSFSIRIQDSSLLDLDWQSRISQPGVVWYHDFSGQSEVDAFRWSTGLSPGGNNPDDLSGGRLINTVERDTTDGITGGGCLLLSRPAGTAEGQTWWRQFSPLRGSATAADGRGSGKLEDDPGADGTIAVEDWNPTPDATEDWDIGFYGHESWHTSGRFDGTEFYLQMRVKNDSRHLSPGNADGGKILIFNRGGVSNDSRQIVVEAAEQNDGFNFFSMNRSGSPPLEFDTPGNSNQPGSDFGFCDWSVGPSGCWDWSGGWDTYLFRMVPGLGSADMVVQVWSALPGETAYTKIWDQDTVDVGFPETGGEGYNAFNASCFLNGQSYATDIDHKFDQFIFSKDPIILPLDTPTKLDVRTRALTSGNTPQLGVNYFMSEDGDANEIPNNRTASQGSSITWQVEGLFYDPMRRRMHQLDRQHTSTHLEHAWYDEVADQWNQVTSLVGEGDAAHWRTIDFDPKTGRLYWFREAQNALHIYDPDTNSWGSTPSVTTNSLGRNVTSGNSTTPACCGFHPNLFGSGEAGILIIGYWDAWAWHIADETWSPLNTATLANGDLRGLSHGDGRYVPSTDELLITNRAKIYTGGENQVFAFAAGTGLETDLSTANSASLRNKPPKMVASAADTDRYYGCVHPRQPSVILGFDAANPATVYYTDDAAVTAWKLAPFTSPFATELDFIDGSTAEMSVGSLPWHGVVAGFSSVTNNTKFCFWRPPKV